METHTGLPTVQEDPYPTVCYDSDSSEIWSKDSSDDVGYGEPQLIAIIGDEDTCVGFLLAGIGQVNDDLSENFVVVNQSTDDFVLELKFLDILERPDIGLVLITREAADKILTLINMHKGVNPTVMIIPGHNGPFEIDLPLAVKEIEERRKSLTNGSRRGSATSVKTNESVCGGVLGKKLSTHSLRSVCSHLNCDS